MASMTERDSPPTVDTLALFGGTPAFDQLLHVGRPNIGNRAELFARIGEILDRNWLTNDGPVVKEFERRIAEYAGVEHCIAMCNGTVALEILIRAADLEGEVIVPSYTFIATAHALQWQNITPVFCDIDRDTYNLDPARVEELITPRTTGIIGVHTYGRCCDVAGLQAVANRHNLTLLFDAAHALGCSYRGTPVGGLGAAEVYSFHATKFVNSFEGGAVVTNDDQLAAKIRLMRNFGYGGIDNVIYIGTNGKMPEVCAAMGITSLDSINDIVAANRRNYLEYHRCLAGLPGVRLLRYDESESNNYQYVILEIEESESGLSRDALLRVLEAENILARRYFYPGCHRMEPYRSLFPKTHLWLPNTEHTSQRVLSLPTGCAMSLENVQTVGSLIRFAIENSREIARRLTVL